MDARIVEREKHAREDGYLVELFSSKYGDFNAVHSYMVSIAAGKTRAGHFHRNKTEVIYPVNGKVTILLKDIRNEERKTVLLDSEQERYGGLLIPPNIAHLLKNDTGWPVKVVVFTDSLDLEDTYPVWVEK